MRLTVCLQFSYVEDNLVWVDSVAGLIQIRIETQTQRQMQVQIWIQFSFGFVTLSRTWLAYFRHGFHFWGEKSVLEFHASFLGQHIKTSQSRTIIAFIQRAERRVSISVAAAAKRPRNCVKHFTKVQSSWNRTIPKWGPTNGAAFRQLKLEIKSVTVFFFFLLFRVTSLTGERGSRN